MKDKVAAPRKKRKSGIPTGNAGEYFVMGELLRRGYDAQLADRNTQGYDVLVGRSEDVKLRKVQIKSVRSAPWYVSNKSFEPKMLKEITIYVLIGAEDARKPVRYFMVENRALAAKRHKPNDNWTDNAFMPLSAVEKYEDNWDVLKKIVGKRHTA
jgi:hypothetical protein